jgi:hypothetical protein
MLSRDCGICTTFFPENVSFEICKEYSIQRLRKARVDRSSMGETRFSPESSSGGHSLQTRITLALLARLAATVTEPARFSFAVFFEERSRGDAWQAATKSPPTPRAAPAESGFMSMLKQQQAGLLDPWLEAARCCGIAQLERFGRGIEQDKLAVSAALTLPYNNGVVEGHVNRGIR